jgi:hypothetical protein
LNELTCFEYKKNSVADIEDLDLEGRAIPAYFSNKATHYGARCRARYDCGDHDE